MTKRYRSVTPARPGHTNLEGRAEQNPRPLLLSRLGSNDRLQEGLLLFDNKLQSPVAGTSSDLQTALTNDKFVLSYETAQGVDGAALAASTNVITFNTLNRNGLNGSNWSSGSGSLIPLLKGKYALDGYVTLAGSNTNLNSANVYLDKDGGAVTSVDADFEGPSFVYPRGPTNTNFIVPFKGIVDVTENANYSLIVETENTGLLLGYSHGLTKLNHYAKLAITLLEVTDA